MCTANAYNSHITISQAQGRHGYLQGEHNLDAYSSDDPSDPYGGVNTSILPGYHDTFVNR